MNRFGKSALFFVSVMVLVVSSLWGFGADGGSDIPQGCHYKEKGIDATSTCLRDGQCGGGGATVSVPIGKVTVTGTPSDSDAVPCCFSELSTPYHEELESGDKKIIKMTPVTGQHIYRKCNGPWHLLWIIPLGGWECEIELVVAEGDFVVYELAPCPVETKKSTTSTTGEVTASPSTMGVARD
jgi:hypothetical protein